MVDGTQLVAAVYQHDPPAHNCVTDHSCRSSMSKKIGTLLSRRHVIALVCTAWLLLASGSLALKHVHVDEEYGSFANPPASSGVDDPFNSHDGLPSPGLKEFHRPFASLRSGNLLSPQHDAFSILHTTSLFSPAKNTLAPAPSFQASELAPGPAPLSLVAPDCARVCGNVSIPYPFGLSPECAGSSKYELRCIPSNSSLAQQHFEEPTGPWPFLLTASGSFQVISITSTYLIINSTQIKAMPSQSMNCSDLGNASLVLDPSSPFIIGSANSFFVSGCKSVGAYSLDSPLQNLSSDSINNDGGICGPISCTNQYQSPYCNFYDCCTLSVKASKQIYMLGEGIQFDNQEICGFASILFPPSYSTWDSASIGIGQYGVQLLWAVQNYNDCTVAQGEPDYACAPSPASCADVPELDGYVCLCSVLGYQGDGYIGGTGCHDIDECASPSLNNCSTNAKCTNYPGSYNCSCEGHMTGDGYRNGTGCNNPKSYLALIAGITTGVASFLLINVTLFWCLRRRWRKELGDSYENFRSSSVSFRETLMEIQKKDGAHVCKIFSFKELKLATNNFSTENELGKGGFGTVFKGILPDGVKVAVKKPKNDIGGRRDDTKQFINEVTILSQVNHRNLVKLLGCCLETRVPLLVYEYVPNGNLMEHLQAKSMNNGRLALDWDQRLNIAVGTAEALNYLHFGTSPPIFHRDVKSSNILLDDKFCAKVADFGLSRLVPTEATHVSTLLQGTPGYMDPEYFDNMQVSDKSDVYSFGVVLLELITAEKPVDLSHEPGDQNLVARFLRYLKEARLEDMVDKTLDTSSNSQILQAIYNVVKVAMKCVQRSRQQRPTMKEILDELILIKKAYKGYSSTLSLVSYEEDWLPLKSGMLESSEEYGSGSSYGSFYKSYSFPVSESSNSSYTKTSGPNIELSHK